MLLAFQFSEMETVDRIIADEVENYDLATPGVLTAMNTLRKQKSPHITLISQGSGIR